MEIAKAAVEGKLQTHFGWNVKNILECCQSRLLSIEYAYTNKPNLDKHAKVAYGASAEGAVFLKNNGVMPIRQEAKIAFFGTGQVERAGPKRRHLSKVHSINN